MSDALNDPQRMKVERALHDESLGEMAELLKDQFGAAAVFVIVLREGDDDSIKIGMTQDDGESPSTAKAADALWSGLVDMLACSYTDPSEAS